MLENTFTYTYVGKEKSEEISTDLYTFKCNFNLAYIVEVEHHDNDIYIIKFFQKNHRDSKYRYCLLNKESFLKQKKSSGAKNFLMILNTVTQIIIDVYTTNQNASFGFMGAPTKEEINPKKTKKVINSDGTVEKTKRYNTYGIYIKRYFNPLKFEHVEIKTSSCYLVKKKSNTSLTTPNIEKFFSNYITTYC